MIEWEKYKKDIRKFFFVGLILGVVTGFMMGLVCEVCK